MLPYLETADPELRQLAYLMYFPQMRATFCKKSRAWTNAAYSKPIAI